jgi:hypothetical protein
MNIYQTYISNQLKRVAQQFYPDLYAKSETQACNEAFVVFSVALILDKPMEDVAATMYIAGSEDGGVDALFLDTIDKKPVLHIFQCKNTEKVSANSLEKFEDNFKKVFIDGDKAKAHASHLMLFLNKIGYWKISETKIITKNLYYVFNGNKNNNDTKVPINAANSSKIEYWDSSNLYERALQHITEDSRRPVKFTFKPENSNIFPKEKGGKQALVSFRIVNTGSANFRMSAYELCRLLDNEKKVNETINTLFSSNIRGFLGRDNFTNSRILSTLRDDKLKDYFAFLNNGITIICSKMRLPDDMQSGIYLIETENPLIINGLQTTNVIYQEYLNGTDLGGVYLTVRLYETDEPNLIDLITDATNTQSSIDFRDKISNKPFLKRLKAFFAIRKVALITKRGEAFQNFYHENAFEFNIESDRALVIWYLSFMTSFSDNDYYYLYERDKDFMKELYEAESNTEHPFYDLLNDKFENFARQVLFASQFQILLKHSKLHYGEESQHFLEDCVFSFLIQNEIYEKNEIVTTIEKIVKHIEKTSTTTTDYNRNWIDSDTNEGIEYEVIHINYQALDEFYPNFSKPKPFTLSELKNLYIPI